MTTDTQIQTLLDIFTDAVIGGQGNPDELLRQYNIPYEKLDGLLDLVCRLQATLVEQRPSAKFLKHLRKDLLGPGERAWLRLPDLSARPQIVAGVAAFACASAMGAALIVRRHLLDGAEKKSKIPLLQQ